MFFIATLILVTLAIAGSAAFFSIYGLAQIFTGAFWPVVIMASSLEAGKLIAASFVYRYKAVIGHAMKIYLMSAIGILMLITSAGIFGFLSSAYQQDILPMKMVTQQIELLSHEKQELENLKTERLDRKKQIDNDIANLPNNYVTSRQRLMTSYGDELDQLKKDISQYTVSIREKTLKIAELKNINLEKEAHTGPIIFIAKAFGQEIDDTTKYLILLIIFVFDPLAVILTIGANIAIVERKKQISIHQNEPEISSIDEPEPTITSVQQLVDPPPEVTLENLEDLLDKLKGKELTSDQSEQQRELERMIDRKRIKDNTRNPTPV